MKDNRNHTSQCGSWLQIQNRSTLKSNSKLELEVSVKELLVFDILVGKEI